jgi:DNA-directed RNA polymerase subunit RPC12/RpoP
MASYPQRARNSRIKCIACNAPVVETVDQGYVCVDCGRSPVREASVMDAD